MPSFPIQLKRNGTAAATPSSLLHGEVALNYADGKLFWKDASNVIQSFTFQAYALSSHAHAASDITSGTLDAARLPLATTIAAGAVIVGTGLGVSSGTVSVTYGTNSTSACRGDDSRLSDTRTPTDGSVTTAKIANDAVTYAKIQNVSATDRLLGRSSAGSGDVEEITCTAFGRSLIDDADAAAARSTLSVQPTASPAFTGTVSAAAANFTGAVSVTSPLTLTGTVAGNVRALKLQTSGVDRWQITPGFDAESGSNAGSTFWITRWDDSGNFLGTPISIARATGIVTIESGVVGNGSSTFNNTGNVVPLTVTNTGTANSFVVNDASGDTTPFVIDASGRTGIGTAPDRKLHVLDTDFWCARFECNNAVAAIIELKNTTTRTWEVGVSGSTSFGSVPAGSWYLYDISANSLRMHINTSGNAVFAQPILVTAGSVSAPGVAFGPSDTNTGMYSPGADQLALSTNETERLLIDASGNIRINGAAAATSAVGAIHVKNGTAPSASITDGVVLFAADVSSSSELRVRDEAGNTTTLSPHAFPLIPGGPSEPLAWAYYSERDGRRINVDMLRVVRLLEQLTGEKLVYED